MEQILRWGIIGMSLLACILSGASIIAVMHLKKSVRERSDEFGMKIEALRKVLADQSNDKSREQLLLEIKGAVSSAVAKQMEYEMAQMSRTSDGAPVPKEDSPHKKEEAGLPKQQAGIVICRSCYKPYPITEGRCPFCNRRAAG